MTKVAIDGLNLALKEGTGIARYSRSLLDNLSSLGFETAIIFGADHRIVDVPSLNESLFFYSLFNPPNKKNSSIFERVGRGGRPTAVEIERSAAVETAHLIPKSANHILNIRRLFSEASRKFKSSGQFLEVEIPDFDAVHWTSVLPIKAINAKNIYTIHDTIPVKIPNSTSNGPSQYYRVCKEISLCADAIVTVSETSRKDIVETFSTDPGMIFNTYLDYPRAYQEENLPGMQSIEHRIKLAFGLDHKGYFIYYGAWEPKKNVGRLIQAYILSSTQLPLVICGAHGWDNQEEKSLLQTVQALPNEKRIIEMGYVPDETLSLLIAGAKATVFPSLYEGFGLPVLESMALGTAVISSSAGSIPEIASDCGLLVNPHDVSDICQAIDNIDRDVELRKRLEKAGLARARFFSSEAYQSRLGECYAKVLA